MQFRFHGINQNTIAYVDKDNIDYVVTSAKMTEYREEMTKTLSMKIKKYVDNQRIVDNGGFITFRFKGEKQSFMITDYEETLTDITVNADFYSNELLNENQDKYENQPSRSLERHLDIMGYSNAGFEIGVNEVSGQSIQLEYTATASRLERLVSVISNFGAIGRFRIKETSHGEFDTLVLDVFKEENFGKNRTDYIITDDDITQFSYSKDSSEVYTMIRPTGEDGIILSGTAVWRDSNGQTEFRQENDAIYATQAADLYPAYNTSDKWILHHVEIQTASHSKLQSEALKLLKANCYAKETIDVSGNFNDLSIGDRVTLNIKNAGKNGFLGIMSVSKVVTDLTDDELSSDVTFSNFTKVASELSKQSQSTQQALAKPVYTLDFISTNGTIFKNGDGETTLSFIFKKDGINSSFLRSEWYLNNQTVSLDESYKITSSDLVDGQATVKVKVLVTSEIFFEKEVTIINVDDGVPASEEVMAELATKLPSSAIDLNANGTVTKSGTDVNGDTYATMIAADPTWAQKIGDKVKVNSDMIVDGAVTANKLTVDKLSALSADLGNITGGTIFLANEYLAPSGDFLTQSFSMSGQLNWQTVNTTAGTLTNLSIEGYSGFTLQENKIFGGASEYAFAIGKTGIAFSTSHGAASSGKMFSIGFDGSYTIVNADYIKQNVRVEKLFQLPYGLQGRLDRIGDVVTMNVVRKIVNLGSAEYGTASETLPVGYRPPSESVCIIAANVGTSVSGNAILYFSPDGKIRWTNNITGSRVWSGTATWITGDAMPVLEALSN